MPRKTCAVTSTLLWVLALAGILTTGSGCGSDQALKEFELRQIEHTRLDELGLKESLRAYPYPAIEPMIVPGTDGLVARFKVCFAYGWSSHEIEKAVEKESCEGLFARSLTTYLNNHFDLEIVAVWDDPYHEVKSFREVMFRKKRIAPER